MSAIFFAIFAAIAFGVWTVFHKFASPYIDQVFGAVIISLTAVVAGALVLIPKLKSTELVSDPKGIYFLIGAGIMAFLIDYFALTAYSKGLPINVGGPIIIGGSIAVAAVIGFMLGDPITIPKIAGLALLLTGAVVLSVTVG
jgi:bacterial/archaeal transporter family protein